MFVVLALALATQQAKVRIGPDQVSRADSIAKAVRDSARLEEREREIDRDRRTPRRIPLTPELERTAFRDSAARTLLLRARDARLRQDSSLLAYDATAYQRLSAGIGIRAIGRDRLLFRTENASRVRWSRQGGVFIDLKGRRNAFPMIKEAEADINSDPDFNDMSPVPYFPGREALWIGASTTKAEVDERDLVHPIALGAEAYYRYSTGDSLTITLSDGKVIRLQELRVEPRRPDWKLSVGSFWFDVSSGQLVRAAYRLSVPMDIWSVVDEETAIEREEAKQAGRKPNPDDDVPKWVKGLMSPMQANLEAVTIEYGLYGGRFWLPRAQYAEGWARASFIRVPFKMEESFKYASVNGTDSIPAMPKQSTYRSLRDSLFGGDSTRWADLPDSVRRERRRVLAAAAKTIQAEREERKKADCETTGYFTTVRSRYDGNLRTACASRATPPC